MRTSHTIRKTSVQTAKPAPYTRHLHLQMSKDGRHNSGCYTKEHNTLTDNIHNSFSKDISNKSLNNSRAVYSCNQPTDNRKVSSHHIFSSKHPTSPALKLGLVGQLPETSTLFRTTEEEEEVHRECDRQGEGR